MKAGIFLTAIALVLVAAALPLRGDTAKDEFNKLITDGEKMLARGQEANFPGLFELAQARFTAALLLDADSVLAHRGVQDCRLLLGEEEDVMNRYRELLDEHPKSPDYLYLYSRLVEKPKEQYELLMKAVEIDDKSYWAHYGLGELMYRGGALVGSMEHFRRCIEIDSRRPEPYFYLLQIYLEDLTIPQPDKALDVCKQAVANLPSPAFAHISIGGILQSEEKIDEAVKHYEKAVELAPDNPTYRIQLAETLAKENRNEEAARHLRRILDSAPNARDLSRAIKLAESIFMPQWDLTSGQKERLERANVHLKGKRRDRALEIINDLIAAKKDVALLYYHKGRVLQAGKKIKEALECYRKAAELEPAFAEPHLGIAEILLAQGKIKEAGESALKAVELNPYLADAHKILAQIHHGEKQYARAVRSAARFYAIRGEYDEIMKYLIDEVRIDESGNPDLTFKSHEHSVKIYRGTMPTGSDVFVHWRIHVCRNGVIVRRLFAESVTGFNPETRRREAHYYLCELLDDDNATRRIFLGTDRLSLGDWKKTVSEYLAGRLE